MKPDCKRVICSSRRILWILLLSLFPVIWAYTCDIDADTLIRRDVRITGFQFWDAKTDGIAACARCCVRRTLCESFNFDLQSGMCELNSETLTTRPGSETQSNTAVYSSIDAWPPILDPSCHPRPCAIDEVCIPGSLVGGSSCAFTCLKLHLRCPTPTVGTATSTSVGSVVQFTCARGYVGGDSATCLPSQSWSKELDTTCITVLGYQCTSDSDCISIAGTCTTSVCACPGLYTYSESDVMCQEGTQGIRLTDMDGHAGRLEIYQDNDWTSVCRDNWNWKATFVLCKQLFDTPFGGSFHTPTAFGEGTGKGYKFDNIACTTEEASIYDCPYRPEPDKCNADKHMGVMCFTESKNDNKFRSAEVHATLTSDVRLVHGSDMGGPEGRLEVRYNGAWGTVCGRDKWDFKGADVVCKSLNSTWERQSDCKDACQGEGTAPIMMSAVDCDGTEPHILMCRYSGWGVLESNCVDKHEHDAGLTCRSAT